MPNIMKPLKQKIFIRHTTVDLAAVLTSPDGDCDSLAVLVHGGPGGNKDNLYSDMADQLAAAGVASLRFDFSGAGESSGSYRHMTITSQVAELETVWQFASSLLKFKKLALIGESYGATIVLKSTIKADTNVLLWPVIDFLDGSFAPFVTDENMQEAKANGFILSEGVEVGLAFLQEVLETRTAVDDLERIKDSNVLFIHGTGDVEVPVHQTEQAFERINEPKKLVIVPDAGHNLTRPHERTILFNEINSWLIEHLKGAIN